MPTSSTKPDDADLSSPLDQTPSLKRPPSPRKIDDAYYENQKRLEATETEFKRERFVYIFISLVLFDGLMLSIAEARVSTFFLVASLILAIGLAKWLEFPWIVTALEVWHNKISKMSFGKNKSEEIEP